MAVSYFEVDTVLLRQTSTQIRENYQILKAAQKDLLAEMEKIDKMWSGPAKTAYKSQLEEYCQMYEVISAHIAETLRSMDDAIHEYEACNSRVNNVISSIKV